MDSSLYYDILEATQCGGLDITDLLDRGILRRDPAGGRSTSYSLVEDEG